MPPKCRRRSSDQESAAGRRVPGRDDSGDPRARAREREASTPVLQARCRVPPAWPRLREWQVEPALEARVAGIDTNGHGRRPSSAATVRRMADRLPPGLREWSDSGVCNISAELRTVECSDAGRWEASTGIQHRPVTSLENRLLFRAVDDDENWGVPGRPRHSHCRSKLPAGI